MVIIKRKIPLNGEVTRLEFDAPHIAAAAKAGQFVILRVNETGERIPLTIAAADKASGGVTVIYQKVGYTTKLLDTLTEGDSILNLAGPLGRPTELQGIRRTAVVGGGLGCAIAWPVARALKEAGAHVDMIAGFRTQSLVILEEELRRDSTALHICTDDGSYGRNGLVTQALRELIEASETPYDEVFAIGPLPMMKFVSRLTAEYGIKTSVSMNPLMVDGTGMCGCCRVTVGGEIRFACVDGPDFDGHKVDFDEAMLRLRTYKEQEDRAREKHVCNLTGGN